MIDQRTSSIATGTPADRIDPTELSDEDLEHVVGGLARVWSESGPPLPDPAPYPWATQPGLGV